MSKETFAVGQKLVELCQQGQFEQAINSLYSDNIVSVEAASYEDRPQTQEGIEAIRKKNEWWDSCHQVHAAKIEGPFPNGNRFTVNFNMDVTNKDSGQRFQMQETALYTVENGKIVKEEFFYTTEE